MDPSPLPASSAVADADTPSLARLLETLDRLRTLLERVLAPTPSGILADYLTPAELSAELRIRENQLSVWKREGFGPPRTRIRLLILYRREAVRAWLRSLEENPAATTGEDPPGGDRRRKPVMIATLVQRARPPPSENRDSSLKPRDRRSAPSRLRERLQGRSRSPEV
jgi:hypothetical protein